MAVEGILLIDKPKGWTSHDVVAKARSFIKDQTGIKIKVGHTGTLDPMATGLMVLVIGSYTKKAQEFSKLDKVYDAGLTLAKKSSTGDSEGELTVVSERKPTQQEVQNELKKFNGEISQTPPAFSAIKIGGKRAYKMAREGLIPKIEPRKVKIYSISNVRYKYPDLKFTTHVSSGTYIRSLAEDIGEALETGAYLSSLRRTQIGDWHIKEASLIDKISISGIIKPNKDH